MELKLIWCKLFHKWDIVVGEEEHKYICSKCKECRGNV